MQDITLVEGNNELNVEMVPVPEIRECPYCDFEGTRQEVIQHILDKHPGYIFTCPYCGEYFITGEELTAHIASAHPEARERFISFEPTTVKAGEAFYPIVKIWLTPGSDMEAYSINITIKGATEYGVMLVPSWLSSDVPSYLPLTYGENTIYGVPKTIWGHWIDDEMRFYPGELDDKIVLKQGVFRDGEGRPCEFAVIATPIAIDEPGTYQVFSTCQWNEIRNKADPEFWDFYYAWEDMLVGTLEVTGLPSGLAGSITKGYFRYEPGQEWDSFRWRDLEIETGERRVRALEMCFKIEAINLGEEILQARIKLYLDGRKVTAMFEELSDFVDSIPTSIVRHKTDEAEKMTLYPGETGEVLYSPKEVSLGYHTLRAELYGEYKKAWIKIAEKTMDLEAIKP